VASVLNTLLIFRSRLLLAVCSCIMRKSQGTLADWLTVPMWEAKDSHLNHWMLCSRSSSSRPVILQIPDGIIFQLWSKQRVELGQNCNQPKEIAANWADLQHGDDNSPVRALGDEPGHYEAHEAPEQAHHNERHCEAATSLQPLPATSLVPPGSVTL
jgi:hypothetical protein